MPLVENHKELTEIIDRGAVNIVHDYFNLLSNVDTLLTMSKLNVEQICDAAGISEWQLYRRKNKPELWTRDELVRLFGQLDVKVQQAVAKAISDKESHNVEAESPFLGPRSDSKVIAEFKLRKTALALDGYPALKIKALIADFFGAMKKYITPRLDSMTLLVTVPSGSGDNSIPMQYAQYLAQESGAAVLQAGMISKLHKAQAKLNLSLDKRITDPIRYHVASPDDLKAIASKFHKIVVVDDLLNSGESSVRLAKELGRHEINVSAFANLVNVENRFPSPADFGRVHKKICEFADLRLSDKHSLKQDMALVFSDYTKQKLNYMERTLHDPQSALRAAKIIGKAASVEKKLQQPQKQQLSV